MIRFKKSGNKIILIFISDLIRKVFKGDRIKRISNVVVNISKEISNKKKKKISILDFGCGSMEVSKKLKNKKFIKNIIGTDIFYYNYEEKNIKYIQNKFFQSKNIDLLFHVLHHIGIENSQNFNKFLNIQNIF